MDSTKKNSIVKKMKHQHDEEESNILQECLTILNYLFKFRLIEKIARPTDKRVRQEKIQEYGQRMNDLHQRLQKIKKEIGEITHNDQPNHKNKSVLGETTNKPTDWRKIIRNIATKYNQVLIDGSYKHFKRICIALNLRFQSSKMETIGIEEWAAQCLDTKKSAKCC